MSLTFLHLKNIEEMNHIEFLRFLAKGNSTFFDIPKSQQESFLQTLGEPKNDIERSYKQYLCQNFFVSKWKVCLFNIVSLLLYFPVLIGLLLLGVRIRKKNYIEAFTIDLKGMEEIIPESLYKVYNIQMNRWSVIGGFRTSDIPYLLNIFFHHLQSGYFSLKTMIKISQYSQLISMYYPRCIIAHSEYSFSSSILTDYCHRRGVKHINVQHGEKLYNIRDSFFHFDECYVWHEHYKQLFVQMGAEPNQFRVYSPNSLFIDVNKYYNQSSFANYKYYMGHISNEEEMKSLVDSMRFAKQEGKSVRFRYHPRHENMTLIYKYLSDDEIEDPHQVSETAVGAYSTVLSQAYFSGKKVLLDDVTYKKQQEKLSALMYLLSTVECSKLSKYQNDFISQKTV